MYTAEERREARRRAFSKYRETHKAEIAKYNRAYRNKNRAWYRDYQRFQRGGITAEQIQAAMIEQNNLCALCHKPFTETPSADHDHITKKFRGLVHRKCNSGLGQFDDSLELLKLAVIYLERHSCQNKTL